MPPTIVALSLLIPLGMIALWDIRTLHAPNRFVYPLTGAAVVLSLTAFQNRAAEALLGGAIAFGLVLALALLGRGSLGYGDVKYSVACGLVVGASRVLLMLTFAFVAGGLAAAVVLATRARSRRDVVAFTPFLFGGVLFALTSSPV